MKINKVRIAAILFFIVAAVFIARYEPFHYFLPAQQVELSHGVQYGAVLKGFLFVQEITMQKRYLSRIDLYMAKLPRTYPNENVFLLIDEQRRILYTKRFSSDDFGEALYFPFSFGKKFDIGRGKKIYACIHSINGDQGSYIGLARKEDSGLGKLVVMNIVNDDIVRSFEERQGLVGFNGSIGARTFESDTRFFSLLQVVFYLLAGAISLLLFFGKQVTSFIRRSVVIPEYTFLGFSLVFGLAILVITPPFMVPDEPAHFYRAYQVSEFNIYKIKDDFPKSLEELGAICDRMQFSTHEKTTPAEILSLGKIKTNPSVRTAKITPDYTLPYLPQAIGITAGKVFGLAPLWLFYLGRLFNLLASIALLFLAIRITPVFKWVFFLLAIMPMTLYQVASMSYDAVTTGLCFLFLATVLDHALNTEEQVSRRNIGVFFILAVLLAAAKQPYVVIIATFLVIPVAKFGSAKRYFAVFAGLVFAAAVVSQLWAPGKAIFSTHGTTNNTTGGHAMASMLPLLPHSMEDVNEVQEQQEQQPAAAQEGDQPQPGDVSEASEQAPMNPVDPPSQIRFILQNPVKYAGILLSTLGHSRDLYLTSFVGLFGWIDTPLPPPVAYTYLVFLVLFSLLGAEKGKSTGLRGKGIFAGVFVLAFVLIETALYVYCNPVGCDPVTAVQGRYFIAIGPLLFLVFSNKAFPGVVQKILYPSPKPAGKKQQKQPKTTAVPQDILPDKAMPWIAMLVAFITLACSVFVILERFYVITI